MISLAGHRSQISLEHGMSCVHSCNHLLLKLHDISIAHLERLDFLEKSLYAWDLPGVLQKVETA